MPTYFFINRTVKEVCRFESMDPLLKQLEFHVKKNQGWHIRHNIIVEADPRIIDHIISVLDYVLLEY